MSHGFVGYHPRKLAAQDDGLHARVGVNAFALFHYGFIKCVHVCVQLGRIAEIHIERSASAERLEKLDRRAGRRQRGKDDVNIASGCGEMAVHPVGSDEQLFHAVFSYRKGAAGEIRIFAGDIFVQRFEIIDIGLLRHFVYMPVCHARGIGKRGERGASFFYARIHEFGVFAGGAYDVPYVFVVVFGSGRKPVNSVFVNAAAYAGRILTGVAHKIAGNKTDCPRAAVLCAQLGVQPGQEIPLVTAQ